MYFDEDIFIYEEVLSGNRSRFPVDFFCDRNTTQKILRYAVEKEYGSDFTKEDVIGLTSDFFASRKLKTAMKHNSPFPNLMVDVFPEFKIEIFELKKVPNAYWDQRKNRIYYVNWLFNKLNIDRTDKNSIRKVTATVIYKNYGARAIRAAGGIYELLNEALSYKYKPWEIIEIPLWNEELTKEAIKWLLEEKLGYTKENILSWKTKEISKKCSYSIIAENNLSGLCKNVFNHSIISMVRYLY